MPLAGPSSEKLSSRYLFFIDSMTAFLTTDWHAGMLVNVDLTDLPVTFTAPVEEMYPPHGMARTPWNNSSKSDAGNRPICIRTRSAHLSQMFVRAMSLSVPEKTTRPFSTRALS